MANFHFNKVIIGGRLTADPELKTTASGISVTSFSVAVNRRFQAKNAEDTQADFLNVTAWRQTAEFVTRYFHKGSSICIVGALQNRSWIDNNNVKQYRTEIVADEVFFVDSKGESAPVFPAAMPVIKAEEAALPPAAQSSFAAIDDDDLDYLPF